MKEINYIPEKCSCCGMSTTYLLPIDKGTVDIMKGLIHAVKRLGRNSFHPRHEIEGLELDSNQVGNLSRPRFHGLVAKVKDQKGYYCITNKGVSFLKGALIPKYAIASKQYKCQVGYFEPSNYQVTIKDFENAGEYWEFPNIMISDGVINNQETVQNRLFNQDYVPVTQF